MNDQFYQQLVDQGRGEAALLEAARQGNNKWIGKLLAEGISPQCKGLNGSTILHMAASGGQLHIMELFIDAGQDVNCQNLLGSTPLIALIKAPLADRVQLDGSKRLIASGADPRIKDSKGRNALDWAMDGRSKELQGVISQRISELNQRNYAG